jgi:aspartyl-tRNA(Asn)/glutamyl-tRNA(Gln) amidotransferase subunit C
MRLIRAFSLPIFSHLATVVPLRYNLPRMSDQKINLDAAKHVATLARLDLDEAHLKTFTTQLESILEYVAKIEAADVTGVTPMAHAVPLVNVLREDVAAAALPVDKVLQNAPETDGPFFKVPKVIGGDEDSAG